MEPDGTIKIVPPEGGEPIAITADFTGSFAVSSGPYDSSFEDNVRVEFCPGGNPLEQFARNVFKYLFYNTNVSNVIGGVLYPSPTSLVFQLEAREKLWDKLLLPELENMTPPNCVFVWGIPTQMDRDRDTFLSGRDPRGAEGCNLYQITYLRKV